MRMLVYIETNSMFNLDDVLGEGVDKNIIDKYAVITVNGVQVYYDEQSDSDSVYLNSLAKKCEGITEEIEE
jgi:hypothetical protein